MLEKWKTFRDWGRIKKSDGWMRIVAQCVQPLFRTPARRADHLSGGPWQIRQPSPEAKQTHSVTHETHRYEQMNNYKGIRQRKGQGMDAQVMRIGEYILVSKNNPLVDTGFIQCKVATQHEQRRVPVKCKGQYIYGTKSPSEVSSNAQLYKRMQDKTKRLQINTRK